MSIVLTVIPVPTMIIPDQPVEKFTEYRSGYCKSKEVDSQKLPDVKPMNDSLFKYYHGADDFSYNSQHNNKAY